MVGKEMADRHGGGTEWQQRRQARHNNDNMHHSTRHAPFWCSRQHTWPYMRTALKCRGKGGGGQRAHVQEAVACTDSCRLPCWINENGCNPHSTGAECKGQRYLDEQVMHTCMYVWHTAAQRSVPMVGDAGEGRNCISPGSVQMQASLPGPLWQWPSRAVQTCMHHAFRSERPTQPRGTG